MNRSVDERALETQVVSEHSIKTVREAFAVALQSGNAPTIEEHVSAFTEPEYSALLEQLVELSMRHTFKGSGKSTPATIDPTTYLNRFPLHKELIEGIYNRLIGGVESTRKLGVKSATLPLTAEPEPIPAMIDRFEVRDKLGEGGFGVVYRAYDPKLKREVAIKVVRLRSDISEGDYQNLYDEGSRLAQLDDPRLARVFEAGRTDEGLPFVVMQYYEGKSLSTRIKSGSIPFEETVSTIADLAEALYQVHQQELVHRDVKPANILSSNNGRPVLVDFGLALPKEEVGMGPRVAGTAYFMSPEQADGKSHVVEPRSDLFSLGVVMFQMLTGKMPYRSDRVEPLLQEIIDGEPTSARQFNPAVPAELDRICQKARQRRPTDRYNTAQEMAEDLRAFLTPPKPKAAKWPLIAGVCVLGAVATILAWPRPQVAPVVVPPPVATLKAPVLQLLHVGKDSITGEAALTDVMLRDVPLPEGDQVVLNATLPRDVDDAYLYLFHFAEGKPPRLLWPTDLAQQHKVRSVRFPQDDQAIELTGPPRRMLLVAAASREPLKQSDLERLEKLQFDYSQVLQPDKPLAEIVYPEAASRSRNRSSDLGNLVQIPVKTVQSARPTTELQSHFPAFNGWIFQYRRTGKE